jgi:hypothetical protein
MQLVSYSPCSLAFTFILCHSSLVRGVAVAQLASPVAYFFISPGFFAVPLFLPSISRTLNYALSDTSSHMHLRAYVLPVLSYTLSSVEYLLSIGAGF